MIPSLQMLMGNAAGVLDDATFVRAELELAELAEELGFKSIWCVEHHFDGEYSMSPDNFMILTHLAARTTRIGLTLGAVILPWNNPLRVAERISLLNILSNDRLEIGLGRGLAQCEYDQFGIDMATARERWEESYQMLLKAFETGAIEGNGPFYPQPRATIAPFSNLPFHERAIEIAASPDSTRAAAELGLRMATFSQFTVQKHREQFELYRQTFEDTHGRQAPAPTMTEMVTIHEDPDEARRLHYDHAGRYFALVVKHYNLVGDHFASIKGYESYAKIAEHTRAAGLEAAATAYIENNTYGTPEQYLEKVIAKREQYGHYEINVAFSFGGREHGQAAEMMRLYAERVMPALADLDAPVPSGT